MLAKRYMTVAGTRRGYGNAKFLRRFFLDLVASVRCRQWRPLTPEAIPLFLQPQMRFANVLARLFRGWLRVHTVYLKRLKPDISENVNCFSTCPPRRFFQNGNEHAEGVMLSTVRLATRAIDLVSETATAQPSWFLPANAR